MSILVRRTLNSTIRNFVLVSFFEPLHLQRGISIFHYGTDHCRPSSRDYTQRRKSRLLRKEVTGECPSRYRRPSSILNGEWWIRTLRHRSSPRYLLRGCCRSLDESLRPFK